MGNPFEDALKNEYTVKKASKKAGPEKDIIKLLENEDAVDPDAVYTGEQLKEIAADSAEEIMDLKNRLESLRYDLDMISRELNGKKDELKGIYNDMTYGQQHDLIGPGEKIHHQMQQVNDAAECLSGMAERVSEAISALE